MINLGSPRPARADVVIAWSDELPRSLSGDTVVVVDTLAATTNIVDFLAAGASLALTNQNSIVALSQRMPDALVVGETRDPALAARRLFQCSNSPREISESGLLGRLKGRDLLYMSNNGTRVIEECFSRGPGQILCGSFANRAALADALRSRALHGRIWIVPAGESGLGCPKEGEDLFAAESIRAKVLDPESSVSDALKRSFAYARSAYQPLLLREGHSPDLFERDLEICFVADRSSIIPSCNRVEPGLIRVSSR